MLSLMVLETGRSKIPQQLLGKILPLPTVLLFFQQQPLLFQGHFLIMVRSPIQLVRFCLTLHLQQRLLPQALQIFTTLCLITALEDGLLLQTPHRQIILEFKVVLLQCLETHLLLVVLSQIQEHLFIITAR